MSLCPVSSSTLGLYRWEKTWSAIHWQINGIYSSLMGRAWIRGDGPAYYESRCGPKWFFPWISSFSFWGDWIRFASSCILFWYLEPVVPPGCNFKLFTKLSLMHHQLETGCPTQSTSYMEISCFYLNIYIQKLMNETAA